MAKLQVAVQEGLLSLLMYEERGSALVGLVPVDLYDPVFRQLAELAADYRKQHGRPPGDHALDLVQTAAARDEGRRELYERLLRSMEASRGRLNPDYLLARAESFARFQRLRAGVEASLRAMQRGEDGLEDAEAELVRAIGAPSARSDVGLAFAEDLPRTLRFLDVPEEALPTGIPELDARGLGPVPGRLHMLMAPTGKGKSWWLVHLAACAHAHGKRVAYVSLELGEQEVALRLTQRFLSLTKREVKNLSYQEFVDVSEPEESGRLMRRVALDRPSLDTAAGRRHARRGLSRIGRGAEVAVREFPQGTLSPEGLGSYLDLLRDRRKFDPDLLLVDYADIMKRPTGMDRWEAIIEVTEGLRRLAQERRLAVATVSQTKQSGAKARTVDVEHAPGAWDKVATVDTLLTYTQDDSEHRLGLARVFVAKARTEEARFSVVVGQCYAIGQFCLSSARMGAKYRAGGEEPAAESADARDDSDTVVVTAPGFVDVPPYYPTRAEVTKAEKFAADHAGTDCYSRGSQDDEVKKERDHVLGKLAEVSVVHFVEALGYEVVVGVDFEVLPAAKRSHSPDLVVRKDGRRKHVSVKVSSAQTSKLFGTSWMYQWKDGRPDPIFSRFGLKDRVEALVVQEQDGGFRLVGLFDAADVVKLMRPPKLERLKATKRSVYLEDLPR